MKPAPTAGKIAGQHAARSGGPFHRLRLLCLIGLIGLIGLLCCPLPGAARPVLELATSDAPTIALAPWFEILEDVDARWVLAEVQHEALAGRFRHDANAGTTLSYGYTRSAYWLRLKLHNQSSVAVEKMLSINYGLISDIRFFQAGPDGQYQEIHTGLQQPFASRAYASRLFVFPLRVAAHGEQTVYLRVQSNIAVLIPAQLWSSAAFHDNERNEYALQIAYVGMVLAMLLFNLLLAVILREPIYLRYIVYMACMALAICSENGLTAQYLWPDWPEWADIAADTLSTIALGGMLMFTREMLDTRRLAPKIDLGLRLMIGLQCLTLCGVLIWFAKFAEYATQTAAMSGLAILLAGIYCALKRQRSGYFFLAAFAPFLIGGILSSLRTEGSLPANFLTTNGLQIGSALEMLLLAFALADRFNIIMQEREAAQKQAFLAQQQLLQNLQASERELEKRVAERTAELATSNTALEQANEQLQAALQTTESSRQQAQQAQAESDQAMTNLQEFEPILLQSEKMAALGQLTSGIAHEIHIPLRTVKANGKNVAQAMHRMFVNLPPLFRVLSPADMRLFLQMISHEEQNTTLPAPSASRKISSQLFDVGAPHARQAARTLIELNAQARLADFLPLLQHEHAELIVDTAAQAAVIIHGTDKINTAVDHVSKVVTALKSFSRFDASGSKIESNLIDGLEIILTIHQNQFRHGITLVRQYQRLPLVPCWPGELNQVWNNLIQNALDAMHESGTLTVATARVDDDVVVSVSDTGCGIDPAHINQIFNAFFTTKGDGKNHGFGLTIARKIIERHRGRIVIKRAAETDSATGKEANKGADQAVGTTVLVYLPCRQP
jgi:signal transduction histidine kinase